MKKGFTLIELLGGILILTVIALITIPTISGIVNKARFSALKDSAYGLIDASELYYAQFGVSSNTRFDKSDNEDTLKELRYKGNVKEGTVIINTTGKTTICVTDGKNSAYKNYNESSVTLVSEKRCSVPENTNIVYLDNEATITALDNQELTDELNSMKELITSMQDKINTLESSQNNVLTTIYPVGSIYISVNDTNPSTIYGGTWTKIENRFLLASGTNTLGSTGGNSSVSYTPSGTVGNTTLTVNQMPSHTHTISQPVKSGYVLLFPQFSYDANGNAPAASYSLDWQAGNYTGGWRIFVIGGGTPVNSSTGGSQPHTHSFTGTASNINTMPPYLVVNVWKRTA